MLLCSQLGLLESALVDEQGRLFVTSQSWDGPTRGAVLRIDRPGAEPIPLARGIPSPGGIALDEQGRTVERRWAKLWSAKGLAIDRDGRYLYAAQTFTRAAIARIELADPANVTTHAAPGWRAAAAALNGLAIEQGGRLYVAANGAGQVWRVERDGTICALARGSSSPAPSRSAKAPAASVPATSTPSPSAATSSPSRARRADRALGITLRSKAGLVRLRAEA